MKISPLRTHTMAPCALPSRTLPFHKRHHIRSINLKLFSTNASATTSDALFQDLSVILDDYKKAPPSFKQEISKEVLETYQKLKEQAPDAISKWGIEVEDPAPRRSVALGELRLVGVKSPESIAKVSVRNDAAFLFSVVGTTSVAAVVLGQLPGDWGFFSSYLTGGIALAVLAIGSVNPGILQFAIDSFSVIFPDYRDRVNRHEAAHFLTAYLLGVPVANYSLILGKEHTDLAEAALQKRLIERQLDDREVDRLSIIAVAGATAEAMNFEEVMGQTADLFDLERIMMRSTNKMNNNQKQNQTRWAAYQAASLLRKYKSEYDALREKMASGGSVAECIKAIESA